MNHVDMPTARAFKPLLDKARYKGAYGGRGSAKSNFFADYIIERCLIEKTFVVCCREIQRSIKNSVKRLLESKIEAFNVGNLFEIQDQVIKGSNGSLIIFQGLQSHTADSIKSLEGFDIAWIEESQSVSQKSLDLLRPTLRKPGSELLFSWNPGQPTDPIDQLLRGDNPPPNSIVIEVNFDQNPWLPEELKIEMEYDRQRDPDKYRHIWLGQYLQNTQARVFKNWKVEEFERPAGTIFRLGADWGFSVDPSTLIRCSIEGNILYIDYEAYKVGCEIVNLPELFMSVPEAEKWPIVADSARPETISHMQKNGFPHIRSAIKGAKSLEEGVEFLKSYDIIVHPRCKHVIDELTLYSYKTDPLTGDILPMLADKDNHMIDACIQGDMLVATDKGDVAIKHIKQGDMVLTRKGYKPVLHQWLAGENRDIISINGLLCTEEHKIFSNNKFVMANTLRHNDDLIILESSSCLSKQKYKLVQGRVQTVTYAGKACVYDIEVADDNEFFANGILVHNCRYALEGARRALANKAPKLNTKIKPKPQAGHNAWMG